MTNLETIQNKFSEYINSLSNKDHKHHEIAYKKLHAHLVDYFIYNQDKNCYEAFKIIDDAISQIPSNVLSGSFNQIYILKVLIYLKEKSIEQKIYYYFECEDLVNITRSPFGEFSNLAKKVKKHYNFLIKENNRSIDIWSPSIIKHYPNQSSIAIYILLDICRKTKFDDSDILNSLKQLLNSSATLENSKGILLDFNSKLNDPDPIYNDGIVFGNKEITQNQYLAFIVAFFKFISDKSDWTTNKFRVFTDEIVNKKLISKIDDLDNKAILLTFLSTYKKKLTSTDWHKLVCESRCCDTYSDPTKIQKMLKFIFDFTTELPKHENYVKKFQEFINQIDPHKEKYFFGFKAK
jgi:hypothetical protein